MNAFDLNRRLFAEALGTAILVATVVGSGIMGAKLAGGNDAIALPGQHCGDGRDPRRPDPDFRAPCPARISIQR